MTAKMFRLAQWIGLGLTLMSVGAALMHLLRAVEDRRESVAATIVGPGAIAYPGQYAVFHVDVPSRDPAALIYTWAVEPLCPLAANQPLPVVRQTSNAGEAQLDTVAGRWRLSVAVADPDARTGQMSSIDVVVPHESSGPGPFTPRPQPDPQPQPSPFTPLPPPPLPDPVTPGRFSQFTADVTTWLADVNSPDKPAETALIAAGAGEVSASLKNGALSHLSGMPLRIAVASEVLRSNNRVKNASAWRPFGTRVNSAAGAAESAGQLKSAADWAEFLTAFGAGLH